jgi:FkbM family methyltransferase
VVTLRQLLGRLGAGGPPQTYGVEVVEFDLPREGRVRYAQWLHPRERKKSFDQAAIDYLRTLLDPGDVVLDIGAHTGDTALPLALAVGPTGLVVALEPNPYVYPCLEQNARLNPGKARIEPLSFAATREDGTVELRYSDAGFCNGGLHDGVGWWRHGHTFPLTVEGRNLDRYLNQERPDWCERLRFIKVDAEGHDHAILETLAGLIDRTRPYIRAEVFRHSTAPQRLALLHFLRERDYEVFRVEDETALRGPVVQEDDIMEPAHYDIFCTPDDKRRRNDG